MIENKRFIPIFDGIDKRVVGAKDNGRIISFMEMFDLLNHLSDENEQLKQELAIYFFYKNKKMEVDLLSDDSSLCKDCIYQKCRHTFDARNVDKCKRIMEMIKTIEKLYI